MSYFDIKDPVPEGHTLVEGKRLSTAARGILEFRLAFRKPERGEGCHPVPVGLLIKTDDLPLMDKALARREARAIKEARNKANSWD